MDMKLHGFKNKQDSTIKRKGIKTIKVLGSQLFKNKKAMFKWDSITNLNK